MLKILQARLPDIQAGFRKGRGIRDQIANVPCVIDKAREFQKNICSIDCAKALDFWITINWKIFKEMGLPDHLTCLLKNLYASPEATARTGHEIKDWNGVSLPSPEDVARIHKRTIQERSSRPR